MANSSNNPGQPTDKEQQKQMVAIVLPVFVVGMLLLKLRCLCNDKDRQPEQGAGGAGRRQPRQSSDAGGWADDSSAPSPMAAGAALEVAPVQVAEPPLVCTYRKADGWGDDTSCGVCLAEMADGDVLRVLPACLHYFHADCVGEWLRAHATCPLCRAPLVAPAAAA